MAFSKEKRNKIIGKMKSKSNRNGIREAMAQILEEILSSDELGNATINPESAFRLVRVKSADANFVTTGDDVQQSDEWYVIADSGIAADDPFETKAKNYVRKDDEGELHYESAKNTDVIVFYDDNHLDVESTAVIALKEIYVYENGEWILIKARFYTDAEAKILTDYADAQDLIAINTATTNARAHAYSKSETDSKDAATLASAESFTTTAIGNIPPPDLSGYYTKTESDTNDSATLQSAATSRNAWGYDKATINDKDRDTLAAAQTYTDEHEGVGGDGKHVDEVKVENGKIVLGLNDDTDISSPQFLPSPADAAHARVMVTAARNAAKEINLTATTTEDVIGTMNALSDSAPDNDRLKGQHIRVGSIPADRVDSDLALSYTTQLEFGGVLETIGTIETSITDNTNAITTLEAKTVKETKKDVFVSQAYTDVVVNSGYARVNPTHTHDLGVGFAQPEPVLSNGGDYVNINIAILYADWNKCHKIDIDTTHNAGAMLMETTIFKDDLGGTKNQLASGDGRAAAKVTLHENQDELGTANSTTHRLEIKGIAGNVYIGKVRLVNLELS